MAFDLHREMMVFVDRMCAIYPACPYNFSCIASYTADFFHGKLGHSKQLTQKLLGPFLIYLLCCEIHNLWIANCSGQGLFFVLIHHNEVTLLPESSAATVTYLPLLNNTSFCLFVCLNYSKATNQKIRWAKCTLGWIGYVTECPNEDVTEAEWFKEWLHA